MGTAPGRERDGVGDGTRRRVRNPSVVRAFAAADRRLTVLVVVTGLGTGLLAPVFALATGALVGAVRDGRSAGWPLAVLVVAMLLGRLGDPVLEEAGMALWRRVDEALSVRVMTALVAPPGLAAVESPAVRDRVVQIEGTLTDITPGQAAYHLGRTLALAAQGLGCLAVVGAYRWWLAVVLGVGYALARRVYRDHWAHVTMVLQGRTDRLRHAYYLRGVALDGAAAKETRVFGLADWLVAGYRDRWQSEMVDIWKARKEGWFVSLGVIGGLGVVEALVVTRVVLDATSGHLGVGRAVAITQAVVSAAVLGIYNDGHWQLGECGHALRRIDEVAAAGAEGGPGAVAAGGQPVAASTPTRSIRFEGVRFAYPGTDRAVFDGLDLDIAAGSSLAVVGVNGAGKTTLVKLLCRLYDPDAGRVTVDGVDLRELDPVAWRRRIAAVFQDFLQLELDAHANVAYGALDQAGDRQAVVAAARLAGADHVVDRLPGGWETPLTREVTGGAQLSGGEWQRLALARALFAVQAGGAGVLILDEPTAALDVRGEAEVYERFLEITKGLTTLVISHRFSTVRRADRIVVVDGGRVVEDGTHDDLVAGGGRYATMYRLQASRFDGGADPATAEVPDG